MITKLYKFISHVALNSDLQKRVFSYHGDWKHWKVDIYKLIACLFLTAHQIFPL